MKKISENTTSYMDEKPNEDEESLDMMKLRIELKDASNQLTKALDKKNAIEEKIESLQSRITWLGSVVQKVQSYEQLKMDVKPKKTQAA
jgi:hypothetical protein